MSARNTLVSRGTFMCPFCHGYSKQKQAFSHDIQQLEGSARASYLPMFSGVSQ
jgi:hypothetical protein